MAGGPGRGSAGGAAARADDLLPGTPTNAHRYDILGRARARWAHGPLVLGPDGVRLAKRHGR